MIDAAENRRAIEVSVAALDDGSVWMRPIRSFEYVHWCELSARRNFEHFTVGSAGPPSRCRSVEVPVSGLYQRRNWFITVVRLLELISWRPLTGGRQLIHLSDQSISSEFRGSVKVPIFALYRWRMRHLFIAETVEDGQFSTGRDLE